MRAQFGTALFSSEMLLPLSVFKVQWLGLSFVLLSTLLSRSWLNSWTGRRYVGDETSFVLDCFTAYCTLALLHLIPACFRLNRRTPHALSVNLSSWFFPEYTPANMLSPSSFVQHSFGTLFLHNCKTSLVIINLRQALKNTGQHTNTPPSFAC